ncbi:hypothetical protein GCM10007920_29740 [Ciceribacter naphthalenivorans]|uniref:Uncharacterized protein n=1 Tax=Sphingomonas psychrolutea TaxID=1259676 RepID=A0ABQ6EES4_9SPHN|nr:hypothetical protein GCM10007920_29740 [Ciceribacter naphthalenivorans]GLT06042.1 hypothetical protein GCM10007926_29740 [Sphingomonas psychrolutea]
MGGKASVDLRLLRKIGKPLAPALAASTDRLDNACNLFNQSRLARPVGSDDCRHRSIFHIASKMVYGGVTVITESQVFEMQANAGHGRSGG